MHLPLFLLASTWRGDCSDVDRCWRLSRSVLHPGKNTTYVCTAKISTQLPLWSNNRQCAECPSLLGHLSTLSSTDQCGIGHIDGLAGAYFDFFAGDKKGRPFEDFYGSPKEYHKLADMNAPYSRTCSESRKNNSGGRAGQAGSYYCVDCFGADCTDRSFSHKDAANAVIKSHCEQRFACSAFDFDHGHCDKNFFSTVCNPRGGRAAYPRRFSDLPGFEFFRNWSHSYADSCSTPSSTIILFTPSRRVITEKERLRLHALCQLHRRCVREHPDFQCDLTSFEKRDRRNRELSGQQDAQSWWNLPASGAVHMPKLGGLWQLSSAVFIFYVVACELANIYYVSSQNLIFLEVASQQSDGGCTPAAVLPFHAASHDVAGDEQPSGRKPCRRRVLEWAAYFLQHAVRDGLVPIAIFPAVVSVIAVSTPLDVIFCGTIMLVILQLDSLQMGTLFTENQQLEVGRQFAVVLTQKQLERLQRELNIVFLSSWVSLLGGYGLFVYWFGRLLEQPDLITVREGYIFELQLMAPVVFASYFSMLANAITSSVCHVWYRDTRISRKLVFCAIGRDLWRRVVMSSLLAILFFGTEYMYTSALVSREASAGYLYKR